MRLLILVLRAVTGCHSVFNGTTCEISRRLWDVHDYHWAKGGDGHPCHFYTYTCPVCDRLFTI